MGHEQGKTESSETRRQFRRVLHCFRRSAFVDYSRPGSLEGGRAFCHHWHFAPGKIAGLLYIPSGATISASSAREWRADENESPMKKARDKNGEMLAEYDFSQGVRGKYARRYARGTNVVVLEPDVAKLFPNAEAVNSSLRSLAAIIRRRKSLATK